MTDNVKWCDWHECPIAVCADKHQDATVPLVMPTKATGRVEWIDDLDDPTFGKVPAREKMPYGWWSPSLGSRGWAGAVLLWLFLVLVSYLDLNLWWTLGATWVMLIPSMELLRTDAIQKWGAITFDYVEKVDPEIAQHLYWRDEN